MREIDKVESHSSSRSFKTILILVDLFYYCSFIVLLLFKSNHYQIILKNLFA